ncbi:MAG: SUMF1/EgtB/PvdO family nonheme iron enzyme [Polyangiaceae bacterium]
MLAHQLSACALLTAITLASACTADFTGYHLESADAGAPDADAGSGGSGAGERSSGNAGIGADAGASASGGSGAVEAGAGGGTVKMNVGGSSGAVGNGGKGGDDVSPVVLLTGTPLSCAGLAKTCGADGTSSCCTASLVPGGAYDRSNLAAAPATVSDFGLDEYEVSVGRFRNFVTVYTQTMTPSGAGKNPNDGLDPGWNTDWNARLPANPGALSTAINCGTGATYTAAPGAQESLPMTCVDWFEALAFCIWDGGRLPTEAEWNYAAAGGAEERTYPWGSAAPDTDHAVFQPSPVQTVGAKAKLGSGKWGQVDMAGNAWEWNLDVFATAYYAQGTCHDCSNAVSTPSSLRVFRGGSAGNAAGFLSAATRNSYDPGKRSAYTGVRCARAP